MRRCHQKCHPTASRPSHLAQLDATALEGVNPLTSLLGADSEGVSSSSGFGWSGLCKPPVGGSIPLANAVLYCSSPCHPLQTRQNAYARTCISCIAPHPSDALTPAQGRPSLPNMTPTANNKS